MIKLIERLIMAIISYFTTAVIIFLAGLDFYLIMQTLCQVILSNDLLFICYMVLVSLDTALLAGIAYWLWD